MSTYEDWKRNQKRYAQNKRNQDIFPMPADGSANWLTVNDINDLENGNMVSHNNDIHFMTHSQYRRFLSYKAMMDDYPQYPRDQMMIYRERAKRYVNQHGLMMNKDIPHILNKLTLDLLYKGMMRVWIDKRQVVKPRDIDLWYL